MNCAGVKRNSTAYLDGRLQPTDVARLKDHVSGCDLCASMLDQLIAIRSGMLSLEKPKAPALLTTKLRVLASRERSTLLQAGDSRWARLHLRWKRRLDEFMRPLTIPAAGGLLSSLALFAILAASFTRATQYVAYEVPVFQARMGANLVAMDMHSSVY